MQDRAHQNKLRQGLAIVAVTSALISSGLMAAPVSASFPGVNGNIGYVRFESFGGHIQINDPEGENQSVESAAGTFYGNYPQGGSFNPAGTHYAFTTATNNLVRIENIQTDTVTELPFGGANLAWSPDGSKFAMTQSTGGRADVVTFNTDGTDLQQLTTFGAAGGDAVEPAWSPNGRRIAFVGITRVTSPGGPTEVRYGIWVMNSDGSSPELLFGGTDDLAYGDPDWSPDGTKIAFHHSDGTTTDVYIGNVSTGAVTNLTAGTGGDGPSWSPDGTQIAFSRGGDIFRMPSGGGAQSLVQACSGNFDCGGPEWATKIPAACEKQPEAICGGNGADNIIGTPEDDVIVTGGGNDKIASGAGNDVADAGAGNDSVAAGAGNDEVKGGGGNDTLRGDAASTGKARQAAGGGFDKLLGGGGNDLILGEAGNDSLKGGGGDDVIKGGPGVNVIVGGPGRDTCVGGKDDKFKSCERERRHI